MDTPEIHPVQAARAQALVASWGITIEKCLQFIESKRQVCGFESRVFTDPSVIIGVDDWMVYFTTDVELEAVFGVEMRGDNVAAFFWSALAAYGLHFVLELLLIAVISSAMLGLLKRPVIETAPNLIGPGIVVSLFI